MLPEKGVHHPPEYYMSDALNGAWTEAIRCEECLNVYHSTGGDFLRPCRNCGAKRWTRYVAKWVPGKPGEKRVEPSWWQKLIFGTMPRVFLVPPKDGTWVSRETAQGK